ncbi:MAG TPA: DUF3883 domain-containing protein [Parafilimonas sp.]|nr:DUF3883 domain-containing protein [Parafilimonas sp.]
MAIDWTQQEVQLIVTDYFSMLDLELSGKNYNKTTHRNALLPLLPGRSEGAIEFKHQNISAALINMGLPYIDGYKPRFNYQRELVEKEIANYIAQRKLLIENKFNAFANEASNVVLETIRYETVLDEPPSPSEFKETEPLYKPIKTNYLEKEQNNRNLGEQGEAFVIQFEKRRLVQAGKEKLADKIEWLSKDMGDGLGYDILSKNENGTDRFIEVKTTKLSKETPIFLSRIEMLFATKAAGGFYLYRVFDFATQPKLFIKNGAYDSFCKLVPQNFKGYF